MSDFTQALQKLAMHSPDLRVPISRILEATDTNRRKEVAFGQELGKLPSVQKFTVNPAGGIDVHVDGDILHIVHLSKGFVREDFSFSVPLGKDIRSAVKGFARMLQTPSEALRRRYGSGAYTHHNTQMRCLVDTYEEENSEECAEDENLRNAFGPQRVAAKDPNEEAHDLIKTWKALEQELTKRTKSVSKALQDAERQVKGLESSGSHYLSAPSLLTGAPLKELKRMSSFLDEVVSHIEGLGRHGR